jgi:hypothetical protein
LSLKNRRKRDRRGRNERESASYGHYSSSLNPFDSGKRSSRRRGIAGPVIIICAIVAVLVAADFWLNSGKIHRGVEVGSVSLGGKTPAEARQIVRDQAMGPLEEPACLHVREIAPDGRLGHAETVAQVRNTYRSLSAQQLVDA